MKSLYKKILLLFGTLVLAVSVWGQGTLTGEEHPDTGEPYYTYTFDPNQANLVMGVWEVVGTAPGIIVSQSVNGSIQTANIKFNTPGTATVRFRKTSTPVRVWSLNVTIVAPPVAPAAPIQTPFCGTMRVDLPAASPGVTYYWQTAAVEKSTSDASPFKTMTSLDPPVFLRSKINGYNNWSEAIMVSPVIDYVPAGSITGPSSMFYSSATGQLQLNLSNNAATIEKWQRRLVYPAGSSWMDISGSTQLSSLTFSGLDESTEYRALLSNGSTCDGVSASPFTIHVEQQGFEGKISGTTGVYGATNEGTLQLNGCTGVIEEWQYSDDTFTWTSIPSSPENIFSFANLVEERYYRVKVSKKGTISYSLAFVVSHYSPVNSELTISNVVIQESIRVPQSSEANLATMTPLQKTTAYAYSDGLGRSVQTVVKNASPSQKDVIGFSVYDELGRQQRTYLPYTGTGNNYYDTLLDDQATFYNGTPKVAIDPYPFADVAFDGSPLNRVIEQGTVGETGQIAEHHTVRTTTRTNVANEIRIWKTNATSPGYYAPGTLHVQEATDQNDNKVITFTDNRGLLIQKHVQSTASAWLKTLYIYDVSGRVKYIFQPELVRLIGINATVTATNLLRYTFQYTYDGKGRVAEKLTPGASAAVYVVYDPLDRPILAQDGNLRASNKWAFVKYDGQGRPVMQGLYTNTTQTTQAAMQTLMDGLYASGNTDYPANAWYEERGTTLHGYTNISFPKVNANDTPIEVLNVSFYDGYDFDDADTSPDFAYTPQGLTGEGTAVDAYALPTGTKRLVMGTSTWLYAYVFYDKYGRAIQSRSNNHLNPAIDNLVTTVYDFEGKVLTTKTYHHAGTGQTTVVNKYIYDDSGHLIKVYQNNNGAPSDQLVAQYEYNELGQIVDKKLHNTTGTDFLQSVDYRYDISGSLSSINNARRERRYQ